MVSLTFVYCFPISVASACLEANYLDQEHFAFPYLSPDLTCKEVDGDSTSASPSDLSASAYDRWVFDDVTKQVLTYC
jgi:hypothetical protein